MAGHVLHGRRFEACDAAGACAAPARVDGFVVPPISTASGQVGGKYVGIAHSRRPAKFFPPLLRLGCLHAASEYVGEVPRIDPAILDIFVRVIGHFRLNPRKIRNFLEERREDNAAASPLYLLLQQSLDP